MNNFIWVQSCKIPNKVLGDLLVSLLASGVFYVHVCWSAFNTKEIQYTQECSFHCLKTSAPSWSTPWTPPPGTQGIFSRQGVVRSAHSLLFLPSLHFSLELTAFSPGELQGMSTVVLQSLPSRKRVSFRWVSHDENSNLFEGRYVPWKKNCFSTIAVVIGAMKMPIVNWLLELFI